MFKMNSYPNTYLVNGANIYQAHSYSHDFEWNRGKIINNSTVQWDGEFTPIDWNNPNEIVTYAMMVKSTPETRVLIYDQPMNEYFLSRNRPLFYWGDKTVYMDREKEIEDIEALALTGDNYLDQNGQVWHIAGDDSFKLYWEENRLMAKHFKVRPDEDFPGLYACGWQKNMVSKYSTIALLIWAQRATLKRVEIVTEWGRGYSGGHNTADRLGWPTSHPTPVKGNILHWKGASQGSFTGYYPYTVSLAR